MKDLLEHTLGNDMLLKLNDRCQLDINSNTIVDLVSVIYSDYNDNVPLKYGTKMVSIATFTTAYIDTILNPNPLILLANLIFPDHPKTSTIEDMFNYKPAPITFARLIDCFKKGYFTHCRVESKSISIDGINDRLIICRDIPTVSSKNDGSDKLQNYNGNPRFMGERNKITFCERSDIVYDSSYYDIANLDGFIVFEEGFDELTDYGYAKFITHNEKKYHVRMDSYFPSETSNIKDITSTEIEASERVSVLFKNGILDNICWNYRHDYGYYSTSVNLKEVDLNIVGQDVLVWLALDHRQYTNGHNLSCGIMSVRDIK